WTAIHVDVAAAIDDDFVPDLIGDGTETRVGDKRSVSLAPNEPTLATGDNQQPPVGKPIDTERNLKRRVDNDLAAAVRVHCANLLSAPIGKPEAILMPARRFSHRETRQQDFQFRG